MSNLPTFSWAMGSGPQQPSQQIPPQPTNNNNSTSAQSLRDAGNGVPNQQQYPQRPPQQQYGYHQQRHGMHSNAYAQAGQQYEQQYGHHHHQYRRDPHHSSSQYPQQPTHHRQHHHHHHHQQQQQQQFYHQQQQPQQFQEFGYGRGGGSSYGRGGGGGYYNTRGGHHQFQQQPYQDQHRHHYHHHHHHHHHQSFASASGGMGGQYPQQGGYRGGGGHRGGGRGGGRFEIPKDFFFIVRYPDMESVRLLQTTQDPFSALHETARMRITQVTKGLTTGGFANVLFLVNRKFLAGFMTFPPPPDGSPMIQLLDPVLAEKYANVEGAITDQGDWISETPSDVDTLSKQYFQCMKQLVTDTLVLQREQASPADRSGSNNILELPFVDVLTKLEKDPQTIRAFEERVDVASGVLTPTTESSSELEDSHEFIVRVIQHTGTLIGSTVWMSVVSKLLSSQRYRPILFARLNTLTEEFATSTADVLHANMLESTGYVLFKSFFCHVLSAKLVLSIFTLRDDAVQVASESKKLEQDILCRCLSTFGFEAVCANLGGGTLSAIVKACMPSSSSSTASESYSRKRVVREEESMTLPSVEMKPPRISSEEERFKILSAVAEAFTAGLDVDSESDPLADRNCPQLPFEVRVLGMGRHVVGCRAVQFCIPLFLDSLTRAEQFANAPRTHRRISSFITSLTRQVGMLANDMYGNYVVQTLIEELARFTSTPDSATAAIARRLFNQTVDVLISVLMAVGSNKCASNCLEKLIAATSVLQPTSMRVATLLDIARAFAGDQDKRQTVFLTLAIHPFGNYVIKQLLNRLTLGIRDASSQLDPTDSLTQRLVSELKEVEKNIFYFVRQSASMLQQSNYTQATIMWAQHQAARFMGEGQ